MKANISNSTKRIRPRIESIYFVLGDKLRSLRKERKLSLSDVAKYTMPRVTSSSIANIENGAQRVTIHGLEGIAKALGTTMSTILKDIGL